MSVFHDSVVCMKLLYLCKKQFNKKTAFFLYYFHNLLKFIEKINNFLVQIEIISLNFKAFLFSILVFATVPSVSTIMHCNKKQFVSLSMGTIAAHVALWAVKIGMR